MSDVVVAIDIDAPVEIVWRMSMDPKHLPDWVTIHRMMHAADAWPPHEGSRMDQTLALRGTPFRVRWTLVSCEEARHARWEGRGPARSHAETEYRLTPRETGTRFEYRNSFRAPMGPLGAIASRVVVGDLPRREAEESLRHLKELCENA